MGNEAEVEQFATVEAILAEIEARANELRTMGVRKIGLFGSHRHGTATPASDMDFLVMIEPLSFDSYMDVKIFLEDTFGCPVDLVPEENLKPRLRERILTEVVYAAGL